MKKILAGAAVAALIHMPAYAQTAPVQAAAAQAPTSAAAAEGLLTLNDGVPFKLVVSEEVNSSTHRQGDTFPLTVLEDVKVGNTVVIPRGTHATGEITWRTGKGAFGKSGKIEFLLSHLDLDGKRVPISGTYRQEGEGNTVATGVGIIAIGVFAGFITGKRARLPMGRELMTHVYSTVPFTADGHLAPSYDSAAAMAASEASTPLGQCKAEAAALPSKKQEKAREKCYSERME
jgi:hypothetical protein